MPCEELRAFMSFSGLEREGKSHVTHESKAPSFGSAIRDARLACLILSLITCLALAFFVAPASATYLHANQPTHEFGPDGTDNFSNENSFYCEHAEQDRDRLAAPPALRHVLQGPRQPREGLARRCPRDLRIRHLRPEQPDAARRRLPARDPAEARTGTSWLAVDPATGPSTCSKRPKSATANRGGRSTAGTWKESRGPASRCTSTSRARWPST